MPVSIYSNIASLDAQMHLGSTQLAVARNMSHLSSGLRINSAADDAAGLGISTLFNAEVRSYVQASRNTNDGISLLQTAEGALSQSHDILTRMRELAIESANGTYSSVDRQNIVVEVQQLQSEIDRIANSTRFGNVQLLNAAATVTLQVGIQNTAADRIDLNLAKADTVALGVDVKNLVVDTQAGAQAAINAIDTAIGSVSAQRATIGALEGRVSVARNNDNEFNVNLSAATGRVRDVDVAQESGDLARNQVLSQAGIAILAQANQFPQQALKLLQ